MPGVFRRFNRPTPGAGVVRIAAGVKGFVADNRVEHADFPVNAIAHRGAEGDIGLLDGHLPVAI